MRTDPFTDSVLFLIGDTDDHHKLGALGVLLAIVFGAALLASIALAVANWRTDPQQRRAVNLWLWLARVLMGAMWFQGSLWKLPLPVSGGLQYWTEQLRDNSAFEWHRAFVSDILLPNLYWLGTIVWFTEFGMGLALVLGFCRAPGRRRRHPVHGQSLVRALPQWRRVALDLPVHHPDRGQPGGEPRRAGAGP